MLKKVIYILYVLIIVCLGSATIIEKYHGTMFVSSYIYGSWWMCVLWALLVGAGVFYILKRRVRRLSMITLHLAFIVILIGAFLTHLTSKNGLVHLRKGESVHTYECQSSSGETSISPLPFSIRLDEFSIKKHAGTDAAEDYISRFTIHTSETDSVQGEVSMNHIYSHHNTRLYQASYDEDGEGSYLTLNSDPYGIPVTYIGYALLFIGLLWILVDPKGKYRVIIRQLSSTPKTMLILLLYIMSTGLSSAAPVLSEDIAVTFGKLTMVYNDRICPVQTYALDFTKKLYGKRRYNGYRAEQVLTGFMFWYDEWKKERIIKVKNSSVCERLGIGSYCSIDDLFKGGYLLGPYMMEYYKGLSDKFHEGIGKLDEKVGLIMDIRTFAPLKVFPYTHNGETSWYSPTDSYPPYLNAERKAYMQNIFVLLKESVRKHKEDEVSDVLSRLKKYQYTYGGNSIPSSARLTAEYLYNDIPFATVLFMLNLTMGLLGLFYIIWQISRRSNKSSTHSIISPKGVKPTISVILQFIIMLLSFIGLTTCLILRWVIRGTIPMSNGYETMLVMAWMILLVAILLYRRFQIILTFGFLLSGFFLLVSHISQMDPQITHLMPVLSSPLLTIHVSIIMMAYALLSLTFICGLTGVLIRLIRGRNASGVGEQLRSLQVLSQLFLYPSLTFLGFGIFIGAIWANVSWGSYWSWDPKETWALITLMVYAVAVHDNSIPSLRRPLVYHLFMTFAFLTILMTYFGVNYVLGGMHSYA